MFPFALVLLFASPIISYQTERDWNVYYPRPIDDDFETYHIPAVYDPPPYNYFIQKSRFRRRTPYRNRYYPTTELSPSPSSTQSRFRVLRTPIYKPEIVTGVQWCEYSYRCMPGTWCSSRDCARDSQCCRTFEGSCCPSFTSETRVVPRPFYLVTRAEKLDNRYYPDAQPNQNLTSPTPRAERRYEVAYQLHPLIEIQEQEQRNVFGNLLTYRRN